MDKNEYPSLKDAHIGDRFTRPLLIETIKTEVAQNGKPYLKLTVTDGDSSQMIVMFNTTAETLAAQGVSADTLVDMDLTVSDYRGSNSFNVNSVRPTQDVDADIRDYIKLPPLDIDEMYTELCGLVRSSAAETESFDDTIAALTLDILAKYEQSYKRSAAAVSMHHSLRGGLLYHCYRMVKAADALCGVYTALDRELLICGAALHDIGKLWEYSTSEAGKAEFTVSGALFGHLYMGASLIKGFTAGRKCDPERVQLLIHMILSHHGTREFGAVTLPATAEAIALSHIDDIDAKMDMCETNYSAMEPGTMTAKKVFALDTNLYKPKFK